MIKDGSSVSHPLSEAQVYDEVERLFMGQKDLLDEFSAFLPDATEASFVVRERDFERKKNTVVTAAGGNALSGTAASGHGNAGVSGSGTSSSFGVVATLLARRRLRSELDPLWWTKYQAKSRALPAAVLEGQAHQARHHLLKIYLWWILASTEH